MNIKITCNYLGKILLLVAALLIPSLGVALLYAEWLPALGFGVTIAIMAVLGVLLTRVKTEDKAIYAREGFIIVSLSWVVVSMLGALPFVISGEIPSYLDAVYETVSGLTTTGASILSDVECLSQSILFWRSFLHWMGGLGILVFIIAIAPLGKGNGMSLHILRAESTGPTVDKITPKIHSSARILYAIYFGLTITETILLLFGGMTVFEAFTLSMGTAGTGGFALLNTGIASYSSYCQIVIAIYMMLFGINFNIYYLMILREFRQVRKNGEFKTYLCIVGAATAVITANIAHLYNSFGEALKHSFFQVNAIITTTGYSTANFDAWPELSKFILVALMMLGACAGSTGGGLKVTRAILLLKSLKAELKRMLHPQSVVTVKQDGKPVEQETLNRVTVYFSTLIIIAIVSVFVVSFAGYDFTTNVTAVIANINNIGPGLNLVGPTCNYGFFPFYAKIVLIFDMLVGRLEIFPMLLLFSPAVWKRR